MSDRTYAQVIVYDCPEDQRDAALAAIFEAFDSESLNEQPTIDTAPDGVAWAVGRFQPVETLVLGERYGTDQCSGDLSETIADSIIEAAPGATFRAWTDPAYDWLGVLVEYAPGLGTWRGECDANGSAMFTRDEVTRALALSTPKRRVALGSAWGETITESYERLQEAAVA